jgi:hypothetical protein
MFNEMSDDLKKKYESDRPTMYVKTRQGKVFPIITDDDNNVINLKRDRNGGDGRGIRKKSRRSKSRRSKIRRSKSRRKKTHRRRRH